MITRCVPGILRQRAAGTISRTNSGPHRVTLSLILSLTLSLSLCLSHSLDAVVCFTAHGGGFSILSTAIANRVREYTAIHKPGRVDYSFPDEIAWLHCVCVQNVPKSNTVQALSIDFFAPNLLHSITNELKKNHLIPGEKMSMNFF